LLQNKLIINNPENILKKLWSINKCWSEKIECDTGQVLGVYLENGLTLKVVLESLNRGKNKLLK